jgi:hypothetical protein
MRIGFEEECRQRQIWWEEMERPRPLSECPEITPRLASEIKRRYATDENGGRFGAVGRHIGRIDWDADASGEERTGGTGRVRFDWTNWDRCRFRTLDDHEYEFLWFTTRCLGCGGIFARKAQFILPLTYCSDRCRKRAARGSGRERPCGSCGKTITRGRFCSGACRQRAWVRKGAPPPGRLARLQGRA